MRLRRITPVVLAAILLTGGLASGFRLVERAPPVAAVAVEPAHPRVEGRRAEPWSAEKIRSPERLAATLAARPAGVATLSGDEAALLGEVCELQLLARDTGLQLTGEQWSALAGVTLNIQAIRQNYEAQIATGAALAPGRFRVEIPAYAGMGDALREKFYGGLREALGEMNAAAVREKLGLQLEGHFAGFGVSLQTLDITGDPRERASWAVTQTVTYWNSVEGGNRLTARSETHFPGLEDPSGERWGDLLATVGAGI